jgi:lysozyme
MQMNLSEKGIKLLIGRERCVLHVYKDAVGLPTIGIGHLIKPGEHFTTITQTEAEDLFKTDVKRFVDNINKVVTTPLSQDEFDALVSFSFNIGTSGFNRSTVLRRLNQNDKQAAATAFMMWNKPKAIIGRRYTEYKQFKGLI